MKNIIKGALMLLMVTGLMGCNLDKYPYDSLPKDEGMTSFENASEFRNSLYAFTRACFPADASLIPGFQGEGINATRDYGNQYGPFYNWTFSNVTTELEGLWASGYSAIFQINYFLENVEKLEALGNINETHKKQLDLYKGEAHFFRAMIYRLLVTFYCDAYDPATATTDLGLIISEKADVEQRLERSTLAKTFEAINDDLVIAEAAINTFYAGSPKGNPNTPYFINPMTVKALKAQVALDMRNYGDAATLSGEIVNSYPLITNINDFQALWKNDSGSEVVFQFYGSKNEGVVNFGSMFIADPDGSGGATVNPLYIPDAWILSLYADNDIRKSVYFRKMGIRIGSTKYTNLYAVTKYPGNPNYNTGIANQLRQNIRPYRSADFCLMAAEAYAMNNDPTNANLYIDMLLSARIPGHVANDSRPLAEIMPLIKQERLKELYMEGNRIYDLKRWGDPMVRAGHEPQDPTAVITSASNTLTIPANDPRFVWPIPQSETSGNPNAGK